MPKKKSSLLTKTAMPDRELTFLATATTSANALHLFIDGEELDLEEDGDSWSGKESRSVSDSISVHFVVNGSDGTDWSMALGVDCPNEPAKLISKSGTVGEPKGHGFEQTVKISADPCGD